MIIASAGHVDHGKTSLVKALTGIDTDRLPDEKRRGMTIDLGFAYWPVAAGVTIGFVDVPGHERFIRNMLCGVTGIDFILLVVAADDGIMPQTREHVAIVDLLGASRGAVALTKVDRAAPDRVAAVSDEIEAFIAGTTLRGAPIFPVSSVTGDGIVALKAHLAEAALTEERREAHGRFRLAIDRAFTIVGAGVVVTGTVFSGAVAVGDLVRVLGAGRDCARAFPPRAECRRRGRARGRALRPQPHRPGHHARRHRARRLDRRGRRAGAGREARRAGEAARRGKACAGALDTGACASRRGRRDRPRRTSRRRQHRTGRSPASCNCCSTAPSARCAATA